MGRLVWLLLVACAAVRGSKVLVPQNYLPSLRGVLSAVKVDKSPSSLDDTFLKYWEGRSFESGKVVLCEKEAEPPARCKLPVPPVEKVCDPEPVNSYYVNPTTRTCIRRSVCESTGYDSYTECREECASVIYDTRLVCRREGSNTTIVALELKGTVKTTGTGYISGGSLSKFSDLERLTLRASYTNKLTGVLPTSIFTKLPKLRYLDLSYNELTGTMPTDILTHGALEELLLSRNGLVAIDAGVGNVKTLRRFKIDGQRDVESKARTLVGLFPDSLYTLTNLEELSLSSNLIQGSIGTEIGKLVHLTNLAIQSNQLTGSIPSEIGLLTSLERLTLHLNNFTQALPTELGLLSKLTYCTLMQSTSTVTATNTFDCHVDFPPPAACFSKQGLLCTMRGISVGGDVEVTSTSAPLTNADGSPVEEGEADGSSSSPDGPGSMIETTSLASSRFLSSFVFGVVVFIIMV